MVLGFQHRLARSALAVAISASVLAGCGADDEPAPGPDAASSSPSEPGTDEPSAEPSAEPSEEETAPGIEPATGIKLTQNNAEIRLPEGWTRQDNFGVPFLRQGAGGAGSLTFTELNDGGTDAGATSLDAIAKRQLRLVDDPRLKRLEDVVMGTDTVAYRLAGMQSKNFYEEYYGALIGNIEYTLVFSFNMQKASRDEAIDTINSMLATWDFNP